MELTKKLPRSSANPENVSLSVKGASMLLLIFLARQLGLDVSESELMALVEALAIFVSSAITAYGICRRIVNKAK